MLPLCWIRRQEQGGAERSGGGPGRTIHRCIWPAHSWPPSVVRKYLCDTKPLRLGVQLPGVAAPALLRWCKSEEVYGRDARSLLKWCDACKTCTKRRKISTLELTPWDQTEAWLAWRLLCVAAQIQMRCVGLCIAGGPSLVDLRHGLPLSFL
jgi:hypothetical protein